MSRASGIPPSPPGEAEREITRTRAELDQTLDALERRLAARHLVAKGFDMFRDNFTGYEELSQKGIEMVRANPIPVALMGLGAAWLIAATAASPEQIAAARRRLGATASDIGNRAGELASNLADKVGLGADAQSDRALGHTGNPMVDEAGRQPSDGWLHQVAGMTQDALRSARDTGGAVLDKSGASRVPEQMAATFHSSPLIIGTVVAMAGALLAALLPVSRTESQLAAEADVPGKAAELGGEALQRARNAAAQTLHDAADAIGGDGNGPPR